MDVPLESASNMKCFQRKSNSRSELQLSVSCDPPLAEDLFGMFISASKLYQVPHA